MRYVYIHGFNSGPESRSGAALEKLLGQPVLRAANDYSRQFPECLRTLRQFLIDRAGDDELCLMGTSLGGFYSLQLRLPQIAKVVAWNPVVFPALQLAQFTGENVRFTDGQKWIFSREALLSYASAPDPREWLNFAFKNQAVTQPARKIFIGTEDELLDPRLCAVYWNGHAPLEMIASGHSIENFEHALEFLK